ncbi:MAG: hypothetical protein H7289_09100 [Mucilaginibacter sp.]|nr:hypothetical protein [Mucilaginibacter sp.]
MPQPLNILTLATGKKLFIDMAVNLARSFSLWNKGSDINFYIATDLQEFVPADVKAFTQIITLQPNEFGVGFSPKLYLDKLAPAGQTLFIDSDCLVYGNLLPVFEKFKGHQVSVVGSYIATGEWFGDVATICKKYQVPHLPKFNGGIYYLENGPVAAQVYATAPELETQYDDIGFVRLRGRPNDEVLMALAMALHKQEPIDDDGTILAEFVNFQSGITSDVIKGVAELYNKPGHPNYQPKWPLTLARPLIVHFLGHHNKTLPYTKETKLLEYLFNKKHSLNIARILTSLQITLPTQTVTWVKQLFRPLYHLLLGARKIKPSERVIK